MKKITIFICVFLLILTISINCYAKYIMEKTLDVANIKIDVKKPEISFLGATTNNEGYNNYANKTHTVVIKLSAVEENLKDNKLWKDVKFLLDNESATKIKASVHSSYYRDTISYEITLNNITGNGRLKIKIPKGAIVDESGNTNDEVIFDTGIIIDNLAPVINYSQEEVQDGKINAKLKANEKIRSINAWEISEQDTLLNKEFACNVLYPLPVTDLAGNTTNVDIKIDKATNIKLFFAGISKIFKWETTNGLGETIGKNSLNNNIENKLEALAYMWEGVDKDFIQIKTYTHTYSEYQNEQIIWGAYETPFYAGYNPPGEKYATTASGRGAAINGIGTLFLGGITTDTYNGTIPKEIAEKNLFGISALTFKLKDYSEYSIVYQIWVNGNGWLEPVSDGVETKVAYDKPIGAFRISLIPKTEKQYLIDDWKKDVGTNNMK